MIRVNDEKESTVAVCTVCAARGRRGMWVWFARGRQHQLANWLARHRKHGAPS